MNIFKENQIIQFVLDGKRDGQGKFKSFSESRQTIEVELTSNCKEFKVGDRIEVSLSEISSPEITDNYELHYNYYEYADFGVSNQGNKKGIEKFLSLEAAKSARDNILSCLKYRKADDYHEQQEIMTSEQYERFMDSFRINGFFTDGVEIYKVKTIKEKIIN